MKSSLELCLQKLHVNTVGNIKISKNDRGHVCIDKVQKIKCVQCEDNQENSVV